VGGLNSGKANIKNGLRLFLWESVLVEVRQQWAGITTTE
jgi:hypothetical protein